MRRISQFVALVGVLALSTFTVGTAQAQTSAILDYHVADPFIAAVTGIPQTGARAEASNKDTISVTGTGTFNLGSGKATGGGEFEHRDKKGNLVGSGTWSATSVQSFDSFGCGGGFPSNFCGGVLVLRVRLLASNGAQFEGVLTIFCAVGPNAPAGIPDAITLEIVGVIDFDDPIPEDSGLTLYVSRSKS
jgi:hypothetical protein